MIHVTICDDEKEAIEKCSVFASRYEDEQTLLSEARAVFPESYLSDEGMSIDV